MCALIGYFLNSKLNSKNYFEWLTQGTDLMAHRGPDDKGIWCSDDNQVGLGHRRLSIIDLSNSGKQPMENSTKNLTIVFNGEIYNYKELRDTLVEKGYHFNSLTDTEVILNAYQEWGTDCLSKLSGMFAFTIFDKIKKIFFCARDRAGEKPFFYSFLNNNFFFASELKVFLKSNLFFKNINHHAMDCYLAYGYVPGELCIAEGIKKLPPAHALTFDINNKILKIWKYWKLSKFQISKNLDKNHDDLLEEFEILLEDTVKKQMVADVPVGILLSGGVDSSLIATMAARTSKKVKTFTVGFQKYKEFDERIYARIIANHIGSEHLEMDAGDISLDLLKKLAYQFDEPIADSSMLPTYLVSSLIKKHCTVALGGDGGDELFGGYKHYDRFLWRNKYSKFLPKSFKKLISKISLDLLPIGFRGRNWLQSLSRDINLGLPLIPNFFDAKTRSDLVKNSSGVTNAENIFQDRVPENINFLERMTRMDFENYLPEDILVKVDRASMLNSLEIRSPFLDQRIVEFAFGKIPSYLKTTELERKIFLKELAKKILPKELDLNRKQGFSLPLNKWLRSGPWRDFFQSVLSDKNCIFDQAITNKLFAGQNKGYNNSERLFNLVLFELWRREYSMNL
jgi:asparagine synthase (glutamine-hydrolysing)